MLKLQHCGSTKRNLQKLLFLQCLQCLFFFFCWSKQELVTPHLSCTWSCLAKVQFISIFPPANSTAVCLCALKNLPALSLGYLFFFFFFSISRFFWEINYVNTTLMKDFPKTFVQGLANKDPCRLSHRKSLTLTQTCFESETLSFKREQIGSFLLVV